MSIINSLSTITVNIDGINSTNKTSISPNDKKADTSGSQYRPEALEAKANEGTFSASFLKTALLNSTSNKATQLNGSPAYQPKETSVTAFAGNTASPSTNKSIPNKNIAAPNGTSVSQSTQSISKQVPKGQAETTAQGGVKDIKSHNPSDTPKIPPQKEKFVKEQLEPFLKIAIEHDISPSGVFTISAKETGYGTSSKFQHGNAFGLSTGKEKALNYSSREKSYQVFGNLIENRFPHAKGTHDAESFINDLVSGKSGYKYNVHAEYPGGAKQILKDGHFKYFDGVFDSLRKGSVDLGGVKVKNLNDLKDILSNPARQADKEKVTSALVDGYKKFYVDEKKQK
ncbi:MAG: glucosaminidase domain-containing protein [Acidobacteria bacterium]|nr:glucosaminidase domain-containing protein [Acidobacteriota bacterium]